MSNQNDFSGLNILTLIFGISSLWDGFTTVFGTISIFNNDGLPQIVASLLLAAIILGLLYNSSNIYNYDDDIIGVSLKLLWILAFLYDLTTSYMGNSSFLITNVNPSQIQKFVLLGLTFFVSSSPILLSLMISKD